VLPFLPDSTLSLGGAEVAAIVGACIVGPISAVVLIMRAQQTRLDKQSADREAQLEAVQRERESQFTRLLVEREETARARSLQVDRAMAHFEETERAQRASLSVLAHHLSELQAGQTQLSASLTAQTAQLGEVSDSLRETVRELRVLHDAARRS